MFSIGSLHAQYNCSELPSNYEQFQKCQDNYENNYFIGISKVTINDKQAKDKAYNDLSSSIGIHIISNLANEIKEKTVIIDSDKGKVEYQMEDYVSFNLQTQSQNYLQNLKPRELESKSGDKYLALFKSKQEFRKETQFINEIILERAKESYSDWENSNYIQSLFKSYILVRSMSGYALEEDKATIIAILDLKNKVDRDFEDYIDNLEFNALNNKIKINPYVKNNNSIRVDLKLPQRFGKEALPSSVNIILEGLVSDGLGWDNNTKLVPVKNKQIDFQIGTILSNSKNQSIYFYPDVQKFSIIDKIDFQIEIERENLVKILKDKSTKGKFGKGISLTIAQEMTFSYNRQELRDELNKIYSTEGQRLEQSSSKKILNKIKEQIDKNANYDPNSSNRLKFKITHIRSKQQIVIRTAAGEDPTVIEYRIGQRTWNNYAYKWESGKVKIEEGNLNRIDRLVRNYIQYAQKDIKNITINCNICDSDQLVYYTRKNKSRPIKLGKKDRKFTVEKGSLHKIELKSNNGKDTYLSIDANYLQDPDQTELTSIIRNFLEDKNINHDWVIDDNWACYKNQKIDYKLIPPSDFALNSFKIKWNDQEVNQFNESLVGMNINPHKLFVEKNGFRIGKKILGQSDEDYEYNSFILKPDYSFQNQRLIKLEVNKLKVGLSDILIPGISNFRLLRADKNSKLWGTIKMLAFSLLAVNTYYEFSEFSNYKDLYENSKNDYETKVDGTAEEYSNLYSVMQDNYDQMIEHQDLLNISLVLVGGMYTYNTIELFKIGFPL